MLRLYRANWVFPKQVVLRDILESPNEFVGKNVYIQGYSECLGDAYCEGMPVAHYLLKNNGGGIDVYVFPRNNSEEYVSADGLCGKFYINEEGKPYLLSFLRFC